MSNVLDTETWATACAEKHEGKYDYSKSVYITAKEKVCITCRVHGDFWQDAYSHKKGIGCPDCGRDSSNIVRRLTNEEFVRRATEKHNGEFSYEHTKYTNQKTKVIITCKVHGDILIRPYDHLEGNGCKACGVIKRADARRLILEDFIKRASIIHNNKYNYNHLTTLVNSRDNVNILCNRHGMFGQAPSVHLSGHGCPKCHHENLRGYFNNTTEDFVKSAVKMHVDKFDYSESVYKDCKTKVKIICRTCGKPFFQLPIDHSMRYGCPNCVKRTSKAEDDIADYIGSLGFTVVRNDRQILGGLEIDILVPALMIGIEYNGAWWHSEKYNKHSRNKCVEKTNKAEAAGLRLIHAFDYEDISVIKKTLKYFLGKDDRRIFARNCDVKFTSSSNSEIHNFLRANHLQGNVLGCTAVCLRYNSELVAVMLFSKASSERGNTDSCRFELRRFASSCVTVGGASKLLSAFIKSFPDCKSIISYSDNRWFSGNMYDKIGFTFVKEIPPDYKYVKSSTVMNKSRFKRSELEKRKDIKFAPEETEHENCMRNGWYRVWDCGKKKWELTL